MGSQFSAPVKIRSERSRRGLIALLLVLAVLAAITITGSGVASAATYSGGLRPVVYGGLLDVNGDGAVTGADDSTDFFGDTDVIDGYIDCDAWEGSPANASDANGDGAATPEFGPNGNQTKNGADDDCLLLGYDTTSDGLFIWVANGVTAQVSETFAGDKRTIPDSWAMPTVFPDPATPLDSSVAGAVFAWSTIAGKVDSNGNAGIDSDDCTLNVVGTYDVLGSAAACAGTVVSTWNGYVDLDENLIIDSADSCTNGCFLGHNVSKGLVQAEGSGQFTSVGATGAQGTAGTNGVSGRVSISASTSTNSMNKSKSAMCSGTTKVMGGGYTITAAASTLAHLTVVANGQISGGWKVRVLEASPTAGTWAVTVNVICATA